MKVTNFKYPAKVYIDDRNIQFNGDFDRLKEDLKEYDVYWRNKANKIFEEL